MKKYVCFYRKKILLVGGKTTERIHYKAIYAEDKDRAAKYFYGKYGIIPFKVLTIEEMEKELKEHENNKAD